MYNLIALLLLLCCVRETSSF
uniref:Uncharacterized protein n=1 Tax=Anguilla anguilla TaxID=7936 RepID=A0A0E9RXH5_ANGAN